MRVTSRSAVSREAQPGSVPVRVRKYFTSALYAVTGLASVLVSLSIIVFLLWLIVKCATNTYCLEWVRGDDNQVWNDRRELKTEGGSRIFVNFDWSNYARKDRFALEIESDSDLVLLDEVVTMQFSDRVREPFRLHMSLRASPNGRHRYYAVLPEELMPLQENEELSIKLVVCSNRSLEREDIVLKFKSRLVQHYVDLITDIT